MAGTLDTYQKKHPWLICVDSDGCAVDTMDVKHKKCFGPCMIREWDLQQWEKEILDRWNTVNLYSMTRGINRFKGLALALEEINEKYRKIDGVFELKRWTEETRELSNAALEEEIRKTGLEVLKKALHWSQEVNRSIVDLPWEEKKVFPGVRDGFLAVKEFADLVIVSSANREAVEEEWTRFGLLDLTDLILCQDAGSKAFCIGALKEKGYEEDHILMVGDAPGDKAAAEMNGVFFYPILVRQEEKSWKEFPAAANILKNGTYRPYGEEKAQAFLQNLA